MRPFERKLSPLPSVPLAPILASNWPSHELVNIGSTATAWILRRSTGAPFATMPQPAGAT